jgi:hypothetical protein
MLPGIAFRVGVAARSRGQTTLVDQVNQYVGGAKDPRLCFEDKVLPVEDAPPGFLVVHQSLVPCERCRSGYRQWAQQRAQGIIVAGDDGYDSTEENTVFLFTACEVIFYG